MAQIEESVARYLHQLDSADRQEPSLARTTKSTRPKEKIAKLKEEMQRLKALDVQMLATPDQEISLIDPDARSMATIGRGSRVVGYNVQVAVDTKHHLIVTHEVTRPLYGVRPGPPALGPGIPMLFPPDGLGIGAGGGIAPIGGAPACRRASSAWLSCAVVSVPDLGPWAWSIW